jgi:transposase InsO family protein
VDVSLGIWSTSARFLILKNTGGWPTFAVDNGSCYRSRQFRAACLQLGIQHRFTRPYTPRTNGKAERFIQTALREWAYVRHYLNSEERDHQLSPWLEHYNFHRLHGSLGYAPPISRASPVGTTS